MKVASQKQNPQDAKDASLLPNISARVPLAAHIGGGRVTEVCSIVEWRAPLFSSHLLQLFGRQGSPDSIASATPLFNTMIRAVLSDGEDRGSGSTAQVASDSGIIRVEEEEEEGPLLYVIRALYQCVQRCFFEEVRFQEEGTARRPPSRGGPSRPATNCKTESRRTCMMKWKHRLHAQYGHSR